MCVKKDGSIYQLVKKVSIASTAYPRASGVTVLPGVKGRDAASTTGRRLFWKTLDRLSVEVELELVRVRP